MPMLRFAVVNYSSVSNADVLTMTQACSAQLSNHIAPAWRRLSVPLSFYQSPSLVPAGASVIAIFNNSDEPGVLGYHDEYAGAPYARVFVSPIIQAGGVVLYSAQQKLSVSSVLSHEVAELFCDPYVNAWCDGPALGGRIEYALEVCDPVESDSYVIRVGLKSVWVSNFVFPSWFDRQAVNQQFDYMNRLRAPFRMTAGGYMILRGAGSENLVFGESYPSWKRGTKDHPAARTFKRLSQKNA